MRCGVRLRARRARLRLRYLGQLCSAFRVRGLGPPCEILSSECLSAQRARPPDKSILCPARPKTGLQRRFRWSRASFPPKSAFQLAECMIVSGVLTEFEVCYLTGLGEVLPSCGARKELGTRCVIERFGSQATCQGLAWRLPPLASWGASVREGSQRPLPLWKYGDPGVRPSRARPPRRIEAPRGP